MARTRLSSTLDLPLLWLPTTATCGSSSLKSVVTCAAGWDFSIIGRAPHGARLWLQHHQHVPHLGKDVLETIDNGHNDIAQRGGPRRSHAAGFANLQPCLCSSGLIRLQPHSAAACCDFLLLSVTASSSAGSFHLLRNAVGAGIATRFELPQRV